MDNSFNQLQIDVTLPNQLQTLIDRQKERKLR